METEAEALAVIEAQTRAAISGDQADAVAFVKALDFLVEAESDSLLFDLAEAVKGAAYRVPAGAESVADEQLLRAIYAASESFPDLEIILAASPDCPPDLLSLLAESDYEWEEDGTTQMLARATSDPDMLARLATSASSSARYEMALRTITPASVLASLAEDPNISNSLWFSDQGFPESLIQWAVASNPSTPSTTLEAIGSGTYRITATAFKQAHGWALFDADREDELNAAVSAAARANLAARNSQ